MAGEEEKKHKVKSAIVKRKILSATLTWTGEFLVLFFLFFQDHGERHAVHYFCSQAAKPHWKTYRSEVMVSTEMQVVLAVGNSHTMEREALSVLQRRS